MEPLPLPGEPEAREAALMLDERLSRRERKIGMGKKATPGSDFPRQQTQVPGKAQVAPQAGKTPFPGQRPDAVETPEPQTLDSSHPAFFKHDTSVAESHKAIAAMGQARSIQDKADATRKMFDAAKGHKHASREVLGLRDSLRASPQKGSGEATVLARRHRTAARAIEKAATTKSRSHLRAARAAVNDVEVQASQLATTLGGLRTEEEPDVKRSGRTLAQASMEGLERRKVREQGPPPRSLPEIRSAIHRGAAISPAEATILRESMKPAESGDEGGERSGEDDDTGERKDWGRDLKGHEPEKFTPHEIAHRNAMGASRIATESKDKDDLMRASAAHKSAGDAFAQQAHEHFSKDEDEEGSKYAKMAGAHQNASLDAQLAADSGDLSGYKTSLARIRKIHPSETVD